MVKRFRNLLILVLLAAMTSQIAAAAGPDDAEALAGLSAARAVFDVRTKEPGRLLFILKVIRQTYESMQAQGVSPQFVVSMRGGTLPLLRDQPEHFNQRDLSMLAEAREIIAEFGGKGARFEACNVAGTIFKVTPEQLTPGVTMIGNSLVSLIAYQNKGYAIVPMQ